MWQKINENLKKILLSNKAKAFYWTTANGFIAILAVGLAEFDWYFVPILLALLNGLTKFINQKYL